MLRKYAENNFLKTPKKGRKGHFLFCFSRIAFLANFQKTAVKNGDGVYWTMLIFTVKFTL